MKLISRIGACAAVLAMLFVVATPRVFAAAEINEVNNQSMCKNVAVVAMAGASWTAAQSISAQPGQLVSIRGMASNTGDANAYLTYSIGASGGTSDTHTFDISIVGSGYSHTDTVTVSLPSATTMTLEKVYKVERTGAFSFSAPQLQTTSTIRTATLPPANFGGTNLAYQCTGYSTFTAPQGPINENYEQGFIWQYRVGPAGNNSTNPPTVQLTVTPSTINAGDDATLSWSVSNATACALTDTLPGFSYGMNIGNGTGSTSVNNVPTGGPYTFTLACQGAGGTASDTVTLSIQQNAVTPTISLSGPITAQSGQSVPLSWSVSDMSAFSCDIPMANGNNLNNTSTDSGSYNVTIPYGFSSIQYTMICTGLNGQQYSDTHTITISGNGGNNNLSLAVQTNNVSNIDEDSAQLNGVLVTDGSGNVDLWFIISTDQSDVNSVSDCANTGIDISADNNVNGSNYVFDVTDSGLDSDTTYYVAACARDANNNIDHGGVRSFTTDDNGANGNFDVITEDISSADYDDDSAELSGSVEGADNVDTWFVYSDNDSTPECGDEDGSTNDEFVSVSGLFDDGDDFAKNIYDLDSDTTYYYRACGEYNGDYAEGSVESFTTDDGSVNADDPTPSDNTSAGAPIVTTLLPSAVGGTTAQLMGQVNANGCDTSAWFQYTTIPGSFGQQTNSIDRGNTYGTFTQTANDLLPGVVYYVRAVAQNCEATSYGNTVSFKTVGAVSNVSGGSSSTTVVQYVSGGNGSDYLRLDIHDDIESAAVGQILQYRVEWENLSSSTLRDGKISVVFPRAIRILATSQGQVIAADNSVMVALGDIKGRDKGEFTITTRVRSTAVGTRIVAQAIAAFDTAKSDAQLNAIDYDENQIISGGLLGAAAFGAGPLGLGLIGWLLLLLVIALIYLIARYAGMARGREMYPTYAPYDPYYRPMPPMSGYEPAPRQHDVPAAPAPTEAPAAPTSAPEPAAPTAPEYTYQPYRPTPPSA